ncbi:Fc receptor-like protein 4 [Trichechus manatus latirostris]|uniref:Fc receptor-like protein 4 n=1 Tax=Trichechus manatus latirostris TaxID=127582 RepID=A0A2Y9QDU6_TRIMA|nr:Fc receptor-like protein 4 [Trichechus manatus latirostris]
MCHFFFPVYPKEGSLIYSEIQIFHLGEAEKASSSRTPSEYKDASVVYSVVKTQLPGDAAGQVISKDEDSMNNYENVTLTRLAPNPGSQAQCRS